MYEIFSKTTFVLKVDDSLQEKIKENSYKKIIHCLHRLSGWFHIVLMYDKYYTPKLKSVKTFCILYGLPTDADTSNLF